MVGQKDNHNQLPVYMSRFGLDFAGPVFKKKQSLNYKKEYKYSTLRFKLWEAAHGFV